MTEPEYRSIRVVNGEKNGGTVLNVTITNQPQMTTQRLQD